MSKLNVMLLTVPIIASCNATGSAVIPNDWPTDCLEKQIFYPDNDGDGFGSASQGVESCVALDGWIEVGGDCDDNDFDKNPNAEEICDTIDNNCSGVADDADACPCQVEQKENEGDYLFCGASVTWYEAVERCESYSRQLVIIQDEDENYFLTDILDTRLPGIWWIGMSDADQEGVWTWIDGSELTLDAWHNGEPNDYGGEDCGEIYRWGSETWNDAPCDANNNFICETRTD